MSTILDSKNQRTYERVFQHPISHNLEWHDLRALFNTIGEVEEQHNGNIKVTLGGHTATFQPPAGKDITSADELMKIRHFLQSSTEEIREEAKAHYLVVIDSQEAKVYHSEQKDTVPITVVHEDSDGHRVQLHDSLDFLDHAETHDFKAYFEEVASHLKGAEKFALFGQGSGSSSAMDHFVNWMKENDKNLHMRLVGAFKVDQSHLTEGQILAKAREVFSE